MFKSIALALRSTGGEGSGIDEWRHTSVCVQAIAASVSLLPTAVSLNHLEFAIACDHGLLFRQIRQQHDFLPVIASRLKNHLADHVNVCR